MIKLLDQNVLLAVQKWRSPFLNKFFLILTYSATGKAWFFLAFVMNILNLTKVQFIQNQAVFLRSMFCPLIAWIFSSLIKKLVSRPRPSEQISGYIRIAEQPTCGSFPSSHAASTVSLFTALSLASHPLAPMVGVWALLICFSRLYLGVHYLSDILGGALLGFIVGLCLMNMFAL